MRRRTACSAAAAALAVLWAVPAPGAEPAAPPAVVIDQDPPDCQQIPPSQLPPVPADTSTPQVLRVRFIVERADADLARRHVPDLVEAYRRIGVRVVPSWDLPVSFRVKVGPEFGFPDNLFEAMRQRYKGTRPPGTDVVYLFTRQFAGGKADCIGGVLHPDRAFALGSVDYKTEDLVRPPNTREGVIAAHEIGHLLGAHHHYASCAEPVLAAMQGDVGCTVMSPTVPMTSRVFGTVETAFIRDHLERARAR